MSDYVRANQNNCQICNKTEQNVWQIYDITEQNDFQISL